MILTDPVNLLCDLLEAGDGSFEADTLRSIAPQAVEFLSKIGALMPGQLARVLTCRACHNDHPVHLEFDASTRRYWHFCPDAGRVIVVDDAIETLSVDPDWLLEWLIGEFPIKPPVRRRTLVPGSVWYLGDASADETELTVVLAIGTSARRSLDTLANAIGSIPPAKLGLVLTTSAAPPRWLRLPHGYQFLEIREIARVENERLAIRTNKLLGWIKGLRKGLDKPARLHAGRPSETDLVNNIFQKRRARNLPVINQRTEAREIRAEIASRYPDHDLPAVKNNRGAFAQNVRIGERLPELVAHRLIAQSTRIGCTRQTQKLHNVAALLIAFETVPTCCCTPEMSEPEGRADPTGSLAYGSP
jgi:hypothetical protein